MITEVLIVHATDGTPLMNLLMKNINRIIDQTDSDINKQSQSFIVSCDAQNMFKIDTQ